MISYTLITSINLYFTIVQDNYIEYMKYWAIADYLKEKGKGLESKILHEGTMYKRTNWDYGQMIGKETLNL